MILRLALTSFSVSLSRRKDSFFLFSAHFLGGRPERRAASQLQPGKRQLRRSVALQNKSYGLTHPWVVTTPPTQIDAIEPFERSKQVTKYPIGWQCFSEYLRQTMQLLHSLSQINTSYFMAETMLLRQAPH